MTGALDDAALALLARGGLGSAVLSRIIRSQIFGKVGGGGDTCKTFGNAKLFVWHEMA